MLGMTLLLEVAGHAEYGRSSCAEECAGSQIVENNKPRKCKPTQPKNEKDFTSHDIFLPTILRHSCPWLIDNELLKAALELEVVLCLGHK